jgi:hypothetical protein
MPSAGEALFTGVTGVLLFTSGTALAGAPNGETIHPQIALSLPLPPPVPSGALFDLAPVAHVPDGAQRQLLMQGAWANKVTFIRDGEQRNRIFVAVPPRCSPADPDVKVVGNICPERTMKTSPCLEGANSTEEVGNFTRGESVAQLLDKFNGRNVEAYRWSDGESFIYNPLWELGIGVPATDESCFDPRLVRGEPILIPVENCEGFLPEDSYPCGPIPVPLPRATLSPSPAPTASASFALAPTPSHRSGDASADGRAAVIVGFICLVGAVGCVLSSRRRRAQVDALEAPALEIPGALPTSQSHMTPQLQVGN